MTPELRISHATSVAAGEAAGAIHHYLYGEGPASFTRMLPPVNAHLLATTHLIIENASTNHFRTLAGTPPDSLLLGLYTTPPAEIRVFIDGCRATGHDPIDVFRHELGHRFGFDHTTHPVTTAYYVVNGVTRCTSFHPEDIVPTGWSDTHERAIDTADCPFCQLFTLTSSVAMHLTFLRERAWLAAQPTQLPIGLGGTIPLLRTKLDTAHATLLLCATQWPDRQGDIRRVDDWLHATQEALDGWITTEEITPAQQAAWRAAEAAYSLDHRYYVHMVHPEVCDIHDLY